MTIFILRVSTYATVMEQSRVCSCRSCLFIQRLWSILQMRLFSVAIGYIGGNSLSSALQCYETVMRKRIGKGAKTRANIKAYSIQDTVFEWANNWQKVKWHTLVSVGRSCSTMSRHLWTSKVLILVITDEFWREVEQLRTLMNCARLDGCQWRCSSLPRTDGRRYHSWLFWGIRGAAAGREGTSHLCNQAFRGWRLCGLIALVSRFHCPQENSGIFWNMNNEKEHH